MRVAFFGTPSFAVPSLEAVAAAHEIVMVVAQPDRPAGRGMRLQKPAVVERALELGYPVTQPVRMRDADFVRSLQAIDPDLAVVVAYGRILPETLLAIPRHGFVNVHASILPRYRGAAPIQRAIEAGDAFTGVSIMRVDAELDHGPVLATETMAIGADERAPSVSGRLAALGGRLLADVLQTMEKGQAQEIPQDHALATLAPKLEKSEGRVTFLEPPAVIYNRFRAFDPWPGVYFESGGEIIRIMDMERAEVSASPRTIVEIGNGVVLDGLRLLTLQRAGKSKAAAADIARGLHWRAGAPLP